MEKKNVLKYVFIGLVLLVFLFQDTIENQYYSFTKKTATATVTICEPTATVSSRKGGTKYLQDVTVSFTDDKGATVERVEKGYKSRNILAEGTSVQVFYDNNDPNWIKIAH